ncbi:MAG TPA: YicC/YloC family endoribonuclease [Marinagarivorans sp.]
MTQSMTGFARIEHEHPWGRLSCEIRSVNHRYLEPSLRMPESLRAAESDFRDLLKKNISRGKVEVSLFLRQEGDQNESINSAALSNLAQLAADVMAQLPNSAPINPLEALRWPGIVQTGELDADALKSAAKTAMTEALEQFKLSRTREGQGLQQHIQDRLTAISQHVATLRQQMPELIKTQQEKLAQKIAALKVDVDQDRLAQELVIIAQKSDVAEELDRLDTHIQETQKTLAQQGPIGRRLDFLMQEFNREANTLSSKAIASGVTQIAVELKVLIEQMREQIQNIE